MAKVRPYETKIRQKYKNDPAKAKEELDAFYRSEGYSPYSGCLTSLIQLPIFLGLYEVIRYPLKFIAGVSSDAISLLNTALNNSKINADLFYAVKPLTEWPSDALAKLSEASRNILPLDLSLFGIDLTQQATMSKPSLLWLFPLFSGLTALAMQLIMMKINEKNSGGVKQPGSGGMMLFLPLFSVFIGFAVPVALVFYWCVSNVIGAIQAYVLGKIYTVDRVVRQRAKKKAKKGEAVTKEEANILIKNEDFTVEEVAPKSAKELKEEAKRKLAEARRREEEEWKQ